MNVRLGGVGKVQMMVYMCTKGPRVTLIAQTLDGVICVYSLRYVCCTNKEMLLSEQFITTISFCCLFTNTT